MLTAKTTALLTAMALLGAAAPAAFAQDFDLEIDTDDEATGGDQSNYATVTNENDQDAENEAEAGYYGDATAFSIQRNEQGACIAQGNNQAVSSGFSSAFAALGVSIGGGVDADDESEVEDSGTDCS